MHGDRGGGVEAVGDALGVLQVDVAVEAALPRDAGLVEVVEQQRRGGRVQPGAGRLLAEAELLEQRRRLAARLAGGRGVVAEQAR